MRQFPLLAIGLAVLAAFLMMPQDAHGVLFVRVADADLVDQAPLIVEASVVSTHSKSGTERPVTDYLLDIQHLVAGQLDGTSVVVRVPGGMGTNGMELHLYGAPRLPLEENVLLFLTPRHDGTYAVLHFNQGYFRLDSSDGQKVAWRSFADSTELPGQKALHPEGPRDLEKFRQWISDRKSGIDRSADYRLDGIAGPLADKFNFIESTANGRPFRWREFDSGGSIRWMAHQNGQPGITGGGFAEVQQALAAWTNESRTPIRYFYGGQTSASAGFTGFDGNNVVLFNDPNGNFDAPFRCLGGGVLAAGGPWSSLQPTDFNGVTYNVIAGADIVTNKGIECVVNGFNSLAEILGHEFGHTLGLGHSCGDQNSGGCSSGSVLDEALMRANAHGDGRGASLNSDDRGGIRFLYEILVAPTPSRPGNLVATATGPGTVDLTWRDNSNNETAFDLERKTDNADFELLTQLGSNTQAFTDVNAVSGRTLSYRVSARNSSGASGFSNVALTLPPGEIAPSDLTASTLDSQSIELNWVDNGLSEDAYEVEMSIDGGLIFTQVQILPADSTTTAVGGLDPGVAYEFRVRSTGGVGTSSFTNIALASTFTQEAKQCVQSANHFCLGEQRFRVEVAYRDFEDRTGLATRVDLGTIAPADSGLYYFFSADNWELLVKVIDGCGFNDHFWVFAGATTNVEYTLTVTDEWSGIETVYENPLGLAAPAVTDILAIQTCSALPPVDEGEALDSPAELSKAIDFEQAMADFRTTWTQAFEARQGDKTVPCTPGEFNHCLNDGRFHVEVEWGDFDANSGFGQTVPLDSNDSGLFYFFGADNWEMLVKVIDGCGFNDRYWVFSAATTNIAYTLRVTDTLSGVVREFGNELGDSADALTNTEAFDTCSVEPPTSP